MPSNNFALSWDQTGEKLYETGVDRVVLFPMKDTITDPTDPYEAGVAWNGVTAINESPSGGEPTDLWADNLKYLSIISSEQFGASLEAYQCPREFYPCDGIAQLVPGAFVGQQTRKSFGLAYRSLIGNDIQYNDYGYKLHLVYGCFATPSEKGHPTVNDSPEATTFSWTISTTPVAVTGYKPSAHLCFDSTILDADKLAVIESAIYGTAATTGATPTDAVPPKLLLPDQIYDLIK
jgi:hypothetical protein